MLRQESGPRTNHRRSERSASQRDVRKLQRYARVRQKSNERTECERERAAPQTVSRGEGEAQRETERTEVEARKEDTTRGERGTLARDTRSETRTVQQVIYRGAEGVQCQEPQKEGRRITEKSNASHGGIILGVGSRDERQNGATKIASMVSLLDLWICIVVIIVEKRKIATKEAECKGERPAFFIECHPCSQVLLFGSIQGEALKANQPR